MTSHEIAELVSLGLTVPTIALSLYVVFHWRKAALKFRASTATPLDWFVLGVTIGFIGSSLDNLYWSIPWTLKFIGSPHADTWMANGVFYNIPFRQIFGGVAAYCHVRAAYATAGIAATSTRILLWSSILGVAYAIFLTWIAFFPRP